MLLNLRNVNTYSISQGFNFSNRNKQPMKEKKHKNKLKAIKKHIENFLGVSAESHGNRTRKTIGFEVFDHEDITSSISALLEVCYYALDGNGTFVYPKNSNKTPISSVTKVLEMSSTSCRMTKCSAWTRSPKSSQRAQNKIIKISQENTTLWMPTDTMQGTARGRQGGKVFSGMYGHTFLKGWI